MTPLNLKAGGLSVVGHVLLAIDGVLVLEAEIKGPCFLKEPTPNRNIQPLYYNSVLPFAILQHHL